jgi:pimeloyl-ACP methyl ester carboxylesterase
MVLPGSTASVTLADGRSLDFWEGGDPSGPTVLFQPGLPASRLMGLHYHAAAVQTGTRLVSVSRPGYGGSSAVAHPSLRAAAADAVQLADQLGIESFATVGVSGGAPFAIAPDESWLAWAQEDYRAGDIMMIERVR